MSVFEGVNIYGLSDTGFDHLKYFQQLLEAGIDMIQLRDKEISDREFYEIALKLRQLSLEFGKRFFINDRVHIAKAVDADGVHLGKDDVPIEVARRLLGEDKIIGFSCHSLEEAIYALREGADYISIGPIFKSPTKKELDVISRDEIKLILREVNLPIVAIGGISLENIREVKEMGFQNVALISALAKAEDKRALISKLKEILS